MSVARRFGRSNVSVLLSLVVQVRSADPHEGSYDLSDQRLVTVPVPSGPKITESSAGGAGISAGFWGPEI